MIYINERTIKIVLCVYDCCIKIELYNLAHELYNENTQINKK